MTRVTEIGDPRLEALFGTSDPREIGVRPTVRVPREGLRPITIAVMSFAVAVLLFLVLNSRRTHQGEPDVQTPAADNSVAAWIAPPPLYFPPVAGPAYASPLVEPDGQAQKDIAAPVVTMMPHARTIVEPNRPTAEPLPPLMQRVPPDFSLPQRSTGSSPLVIDTGIAPEGSAPVTARPGLTTNGPSIEPLTRTRASALSSPSMTVPQGYLIPAVLETGFDSTKAGYSRAVVSRDVRGFDGKNVLIPRGSRLIGQSETAYARVQNRAVITWTRLIRPDGMTIGLDSPAVDPTGRAGVAASVNTHFLTRLADALLQSTFAIGQAFAGRTVAGPVVVVGSNAASAGSQLAVPTTNYVPTLKIPPGKSISVFVAHDLDFSAAGSEK